MAQVEVHLDNSFSVMSGPHGDIVGAPANAAVDNNAHGWRPSAARGGQGLRRAQGQHGAPTDHVEGSAPTCTVTAVSPGGLALFAGAIVIYVTVGLVLTRRNRHQVFEKLQSLNGARVEMWIIVAKTRMRTQPGELDSSEMAHGWIEHRTRQGVRRYPVFQIYGVEKCEQQESQ